MKTKLLSLLTVILFSLPITAQQLYTVSGYVKDSITGESLISANIININTQKGVTTNNYGYYTFISSDKEVELYFSYIGCTSKRIKLHLRSDTIINIMLSQQNELDEVLIAGKKDDFVMQSDNSGGYLLNLKNMHIQPVLFGETDILKSIQSLPGIKSGKEGTAGFYVRGGSPDQNLILLDGIPVYNTSHLYGFFSAFNSDALNSVKVYKDGMPAQYGGRLSSAVDIYMKEGNSNELKVNGSIGIISSKLTIEGPIIKEKASFMVSARRTYLDLVLKPMLDNSAFGGYHFSDFCAKLNYSFSPKNKLYMSLYSGNDKSKDQDVFNYEYEGTKSTYNDTYEFGWKTKTAALRWNYVFTPRLFSNTTLAYSDYNFYDKDISEGTIKKVADPKVYNSSYLNMHASGIADIIVKQQFDYNTKNQNIKIGAQYIQHTFSPNHSKEKFLSEEEPKFNRDTIYNAKQIIADEFRAYAEDEFNLLPSLKLNIGLNYSIFQVDNHSYHSVEPRLLANYKFGKMGIKASFTKTAQNIHLLTNTSIGMPSDLWLPPTKTIKPQNGVHYNLGFYAAYDQLNFGADVYYRKMNNLIEYTEGAFYGQIKDEWQKLVEQGKGEAYGLDLFAKYKINKLDMYLAYSLSKSTRQFENVSQGRAYPYRFDRTHDITLSAKYKINKNITFSAAWYYMTGESMTLSSQKTVSNFMLSSEHYRGGIYGSSQSVPNKKDFDAQVRWDVLDRPHSKLQIPYFENRNNFKMPAYHRLDLAFLFEKQKKRFFRTLTCGIYNVYNKQNVFYYYFEADKFTMEVKLKQTTLFPILPYINYSIKF